MSTEPTKPSNRIKELRRLRGLTMAEVARMVDVHFTTIQKFETGQRRMSDGIMLKIAQALDVDVKDLVYDIPGTVPVRLVPIISKAAVSSWREAIHNPDGHIPAPIRGELCFAIQPIGDSLNAFVNEYATIIIDPEQLDLLDCKLYAITNGEQEATFQRFRSELPRFESASINPDHKPISLGREPFTVIGRVVWQCLDL